MPNKSCLIYETLNGVKDLNVKRDGDLMTLSGCFGVCGIKNDNKRIYEASNYSKMITEMKSRIKAEGGIPGELEHPQQMNITLENVSHKITDINIDENGVVTGSITLLNTPKGKIAQAIVEGGLPLFISSRATGNVDKEGHVCLERIATYDLVGTPGFSQAKLHLNENQIAESINESMYYVTEKDSNENKDNNDDMNLEEILEKLNSLEERIQELEEENQNLRDGVDEKINESYKKIVSTIADGVQKWIVEEYSPEVERWCKTELADGIQKWIVEEYSQGIEDWLNESYVEKVQEVVDESKKTSLNTIDETLKLLESIESPSKPKYRSKVINESINESIDEPRYIQEMPADKRPLWDMASNEVKESIHRRAKLYNFVNEGSIERFWDNVNFDNVKPAKNIYEGLETIENERERQIRSAFRKWRNR